MKQILCRPISSVVALGDGAEQQHLAVFGTAPFRFARGSHSVPCPPDETDGPSSPVARALLFISFSLFSLFLALSSRCLVLWPLFGLRGLAPYPSLCPLSPMLPTLLPLSDCDLRRQVTLSYSASGLWTVDLWACGLAGFGDVAAESPIVHAVLVVPPRWCLPLPSPLSHWSIS